MTRSRPTSTAALLLAACAVAASGAALAQPRATVQLGMGGQAVANAWNPLVVEVRDLPRATLRVDIDAGTLQQGAVPQELEWTLPASGGLQRAEGELFLPTWRSLSWRVRQGERVVASGALGPRERDDRPLDVVVSAEPGRWRGSYPEDARMVGVAASELPESAGAWDGVRSLLIDGSAAAPRGEALLAAAGAGVAVFVVEPLSAGHEELAPLLEGPALAVGAGRIEGRADGEPADAPSPPRRALEAAVAAATPAPTWSHPAGAAIAGLAVAYGAAILLMMRYGGAPGLLSSVMLAVAASAAALTWLRPPEVAPDARGTLALGAGGLAYRVEIRHLARLPEGATQLPGAWRPFEPRRLRWEDAATRVPMPAAGRTSLAAAPSLADPPLAWREGRLVNLGERAWRDVWVVGMGAQGPLGPDEALQAREGGGAPPPAWATLAATLPEGAALATTRSDAAVAFREPAAWSGAEGTP